MLGNSARSSKVLTSVSGLKSSALARVSQYGEPVSGQKCHRTAACKYADGSSIGSVRGKSIREKSVSRACDVSSGILPLSAADVAGCQDRPSIRAIWLEIRVRRKMSPPTGQNIGVADQLHSSRFANANVRCQVVGDDMSGSRRGSHPIQLPGEGPENSSTC